MIGRPHCQPAAKVRTCSSSGPAPRGAGECNRFHLPPDPACRVLTPFLMRHEQAQPLNPSELSLHWQDESAHQAVPENLREPNPAQSLPRPQVKRGGMSPVQWAVLGFIVLVEFCILVGFAFLIFPWIGTTFTLRQVIVNRFESAICYPSSFRAHNEEKRLPPTLEQVFAFLDNQNSRQKVLVVENGSTDRTYELAQSYSPQHKNLRVIQENGRGKGLAVRHGMLEARGEYRLRCCDADFVHAHRRNGQVLAPDIADFDIVIASRESTRLRTLQRTALSSPGRPFDQPDYPPVDPARVAGYAMRL